MSILHTLQLDDRSAGPRGSRTRAIGPVGTAARVVLGATSLAPGLLASGDGIEWAALLAGLAGFPAALGLAQLLRLSVAGTQLRAAGPVAFCLNTAVLAVLLGTPVTCDPTLVFLGASILLAASRPPGCESLAISN